MGGIDRRVLLGSGAAALLAARVGQAEASAFSNGDRNMHEDLIVVGGSFAGMSAALYLGRAGRKILILDAAQPRNRFADKSHGVLGFDGINPANILEDARKQLLHYPNIRFASALVTGATKRDGLFEVPTRAGEVFQGRRLLLASGVADSLPPIEGMKERWGKTVLHCPYCHGYEFTGKRAAIFANGPMAAHQALLIADWGPVTLFTNGVFQLDESQKARLAARKVVVEESPITALTGQGTTLEAVRLQDGNMVAVDVLYIATRVDLANAWIETLGCEIVEGPLGPMIKVDERQTATVPGVFAAGDCARQPHNVTFACEGGVKAAMTIHMSLIEEEIQRALPGA